MVRYIPNPLNPGTLITDEALPGIAIRSNPDLTKFKSSSLFQNDTNFPRISPLGWDIASEKAETAIPATEQFMPDVIYDAIQQLEDTIKYLRRVAPTKERLYDKEKDLLFLLMEAVPFQTGVVLSIPEIIEDYLPHRRRQVEFVEEQVAMLRGDRDPSGRWRRQWQRNLLVLGMNEEGEVKGSMNEV